jgi:hypothetical protein
MNPGRVTLFLRDAESQAVRAALAPDGVLGDVVTERPLAADALAATLAADRTRYALDGRAVFVSLYSELERGDGGARDLEATQRAWVELLSRLRAVGASPYVLNVFRHVREARGDAPLRDPTGLRERIRGLNLVGEHLAWRGQAVLVDVDRALSSIGGRQLQADFTWSEGEGLDKAIAAAATAVVEALSSVPFARR